MKFTPVSDIVEKVERQRNFFGNGKTKDIKYRRNALESLLRTIEFKESDILNALKADFSKSNFETYATEIALVKGEIKLTLKNLKKWTDLNYKGISLLSFPGKLYSKPEPFGSVLVIAPWNYPFLLAMNPLVGAIAAGNTVILKPSELTPNTAILIEEIIYSSLEKAHVDIIQGGVTETQELLNLKFDYIFFTGSTNVGKIVYEKAAQHLTPVTLELGGKSPCIILEDCDIKTTAKRIIWGKFLNGGQTCIAPDYLLVHKNIRLVLIEEMKTFIKEFYGEDPKQSPDFPRIINTNNFQRLRKYLENGEVLIGGDYDESELYISPTLLEVGDLESSIMKEEIFGPILPIIEFTSIAEIDLIIEKNPNPLALYVFSRSKKSVEYFINKHDSGDVVINDVVSHFGENQIGVGGVGNSGIGKYHGKESFNTFSHLRSVMKRGTWLDIPLRYPPYKNKIGMLKKILEWI